MSEHEVLRDDPLAQPGDDRRQTDPDESEQRPGLEFENEPSPHQGEEGQEPA